MEKYNKHDLAAILSSINRSEMSESDCKVIKFLEKMNNSKTESKIPEPTKLEVSTRSAKCKLTKKINMKKLAEVVKKIVENEESNYIVGLGSTKKRRKNKKNASKKQNQGKQTFLNQITLIIKSKKNGKKINVKFFLNGSISMTGCRDENDGVMAIENFLEEMKKYPEVFEDKDENEVGNKNEDDKNRGEDVSVYDYKITLINSNFSCGFKIDRAKLFKIITENYRVYVSYNPGFYQGVKISYMYNDQNKEKNGLCICKKKCKYEKNMRKKNTCKIITISVFQSGSIIVTGAFYIHQSLEAYDFINGILKKHYSEIVTFSILDC